MSRELMIIFVIVLIGWVLIEVMPTIERIAIALAGC